MTKTHGCLFFHKIVWVRQLSQVPGETQSHWEEIWGLTEFVVVLVLPISSTLLALLALLPNPVDLGQAYALREKLWQYLQLSTSHSESFLHSTSKIGSKKERKFTHGRERDVPILRYLIWGKF